MNKADVGTPIVYYPSQAEQPQPGQIQEIPGSAPGNAHIVAWCPLYGQYKPFQNVPYGLNAYSHFWLFVGQTP